jgi:Domain of unknown function (DUF4291)
MSFDGERLIRAAYTAATITVYQAYGPEIADPAVGAGTLVPPFSRDRMTWIKPSFGWMMYRSGWAAKPGQERILAIEISRSGFDWALAHSCLSHYSPQVHASSDAWAALKDSSPVRIQWDPDRAVTGDRLSRRAIQIGLSRDAVHHYCDDWIRSVTDITATVHQLQQLVRTRQIADAGQLLPAEQVYPISPVLARRIGAGPGHQDGEDNDDGGGT